jgi:speckle-type POZ protein
MTDSGVQTAKTEASTEASVFRWEVKNFSLLPNAVGEQYRTLSPPFKAGPHEWCLWLFPGGEKEAVKDSVSVFVALKSTGKACAKHQLSIVSRCGNTTHVRTDAKTFEYERGTDKEAWGFADFIERKTLQDEKNGHKVNDTVFIECRLSVLSHSPPPRKSQPVASKLQESLDNLLESGLHSDVTLVVEGTEMPAHKNILAARSPVFKAMFSHKMKESLDGVVHLGEISATVFKALLK